MQSPDIQSNAFLGKDGNNVRLSNGPFFETMTKGKEALENEQCIQLIYDGEKSYILGYN